MVRARDLEERVVLLPLPLDREDHVVGIELPRRLVAAVRMPLHALAEVEGIDLAVGRDVPLLRERRNRAKVLIEPDQWRVEQERDVAVVLALLEHGVRAEDVGLQPAEVLPPEERIIRVD